MKNSSFVKFSMRFTLVHTATYLVFGVLFMIISGYFDYFEKDPLFSQVMRGSDDLIVRIAVLIQLIRGFLMALAVYPFRAVILESKNGFLKLFLLLFLLTSICSVITGPGSIEGFIYTNFKFDPLIGVPEITVQMFTFSYLFCLWERAAEKKLGENAAKE